MRYHETVAALRTAAGRLVPGRGDRAPQPEPGAAAVLADRARQAPAPGAARVEPRPDRLPAPPPIAAPPPGGPPGAARVEPRPDRFPAPPPPAAAPPPGGPPGYKRPGGFVQTNTIIGPEAELAARRYSPAGGARYALEGEITAARTTATALAAMLNDCRNAIAALDRALDRAYAKVGELEGENERLLREPSAFREAGQ